MTTAEYLARDRHLRRAQQEVATLWILAEHRTRVALVEAIGTNVFVHAGKGPSRAGGSGSSTRRGSGPAGGRVILALCCTTFVAAGWTPRARP
jgi:hypothetical protein